MTCTFCRIVAGELASDRVFEDARLLAFLDHRPLFPGHVLIVPRTHVATFAELPDALAGPLFLAARQVSSALGPALGAEGAFVALNDRVSQSVPHVHLHVVPRRRKDGLRGFFWPRHPYPSDEERRACAEKIAAALAAASPRAV